MTTYDVHAHAIVADGLAPWRRPTPITGPS